MEYLFCGKFVYMNYDHSLQEENTWYIGIDSDKKQLVATKSNYERFNLYGDLNQGFVMQAMNGKYVIYQKEMGYVAVEENVETATAFARVALPKTGSKERYHLVHTDPEGNQYCLGIDHGVLMTYPYTGPSQEETCCFANEQLANGLDELLMYGGVGDDLTYANLQGQDFTFASFSKGILDYADFSGCILKNVSITMDKTSAKNVNFTNCDLSNAMLAGAIFTGSDFSNSDLTDAVCNKADFTGCCFNKATMNHAQMDHAIMKSVMIQYANGIRCDFAGTDLSDSNLLGSDFTMGTFFQNTFENAILDHTIMTGSSFTSGTVNANTTFQYANLSESTFKDMTLANAAFTHAILKNCIFDGSDMNNCDLSYADLTKASFQPINGKNVNLVGATLANSNLAGANFTGAQLGTCGDSNDEKAADLSGAYMSNAIFDHANLYGVNMTGVNWYGSDASADKAELQLINFTNANLSKMKFTGARLNGCVFDYANLFEANFNHSVLAPVSNVRKVSFSKANLQGSNLMDCEIRQAVFTNAAIAINDGPYFALPYNTEEYHEPTQSLNDIKAMLNTSTTIPSELREVFERAGYPLEEYATLTTDYTNYSWHIINGSNKTYARYNIYLAGEVIQIAGPTIGVPMFAIDGVTQEDINELDDLSKASARSSLPQQLPDVILDAFTENGYELQDPRIASNCVKGSKWLLQNMTQRGNDLVEGYIEFNLKALKMEEESGLYRLKVYGYTIATIRVDEEQRQEQEITYIYTTALIQNNLTDETICPNGQKCELLYDERETVRITWEQAMTANVLPKPPKDIPVW